MKLQDLLQDIEPGDCIRREAWPPGAVIVCRGAAGLFWDRNNDFWTLRDEPIFEAPPEEELPNYDFDVHAEDWVRAGPPAADQPT